MASVSGGNGNISPSGDVVVTDGAAQAFTMIPDWGFEVSDIAVDGISVGVANSYEFSSVTADHTITVEFGRVSHLGSPVQVRLPVSLAATFPPDAH